MWLFWILFALGMGTVATILALLVGMAAAAAGPALLGSRLTGRQLLRQAIGRVLPLLLIALVAGAACGLGALAAVVPWFFLYGFLGPAAPALMIDKVGPGQALTRSFGLASRCGLRAAFMRIGGYLSWLAIRLALGLGGAQALKLVLPETESWQVVTSMVALLLVNSVAYATLACLDAVVYLETRMRTEGLDLAVARAQRLGRRVDLAESALLGAPPVPVRR